MTLTRRALFFVPFVLLLSPRKLPYEPPKLTYLFTLPKPTGPFVPREKP